MLKNLSGACGLIVALSFPICGGAFAGSDMSSQGDSLTSPVKVVETFYKTYYAPKKTKAAPKLEGTSSEQLSQSLKVQRESQPKDALPAEVQKYVSPKYLAKLNKVHNACWAAINAEKNTEDVCPDSDEFSCSQDPPEHWHADSVAEIKGNDAVVKIVGEYEETGKSVPDESKIRVSLSRNKGRWQISKVTCPKRPGS